MQAAEVLAARAAGAEEALRRRESAAAAARAARSRPRGARAGAAPTAPALRRRLAALARGREAACARNEALAADARALASRSANPAEAAPGSREADTALAREKALFLELAAKQLYPRWRAAVERSQAERAQAQREAAENAAETAVAARARAAEEQRRHAAEQLAADTTAVAAAAARQAGSAPATPQRQPVPTMEAPQPQADEQAELAATRAAALNAARVAASRGDAAAFQVFAEAAGMPVSPPRAQAPASPPVPPLALAQVASPSSQPPRQPPQQRQQPPQQQQQQQQQQQATPAAAQPTLSQQLRPSPESVSVAEAVAAAAADPNESTLDLSSVVGGAQPIAAGPSGVGLPVSAADDSIDDPDMTTAEELDERRRQWHAELERRDAELRAERAETDLLPLPKSPVAPPAAVASPSKATQATVEAPAMRPSVALKADDRVTALQRLTAFVYQHRNDSGAGYGAGAPPIEAAATDRHVELASEGAGSLAAQGSPRGAAGAVRELIQRWPSSDPEPLVSAAAARRLEADASSSGGAPVDLEQALGGGAGPAAVRLMCRHMAALCDAGSTSPDQAGTALLNLVKRSSGAAAMRPAALRGLLRSLVAAIRSETEAGKRRAEQRRANEERAARAAQELKDKGKEVVTDMSPVPAPATAPAPAPTASASPQRAEVSPARTPQHRRPSPQQSPREGDAEAKPKRKVKRGPLSSLSLAGVSPRSSTTASGGRDAARPGTAPGHSSPSRAAARTGELSPRPRTAPSGAEAVRSTKAAASIVRAALDEDSLDMSGLMISSSAAIKAADAASSGAGDEPSDEFDF